MKQKEKVQYFVSTKMGLIFDDSQLRLEKIIKGADNDTTIGDLVNRLSEELCRVGNRLKGASADFSNVKLSDL